MTFCLGMKVEEGLVGIADTRVTTGAECITAGKVSIDVSHDIRITIGSRQSCDLFR